MTEDSGYWDSFVEFSDGETLPLKQWRSNIAKGSDDEIPTIYKASANSIVISEATEKGRVIESIITGPEKDRYGDTVDPDGWDFKNYQRNPVVLWAHNNLSPPIGKSLEIKRRGKQWVSKDEFAQQHQNPLSETIFQLVKGGFVNATSVGFLPTDYDFDEDEWTFEFKKQELLEHSFVPVPAYPKALVTARSKGIDLEPLRDFCERYLDEHHQNKGLYVPVTKLLAVTNSLGYEHGTKFFDLSVPEMKREIEGVVENPKFTGTGSEHLSARSVASTLSNDLSASSTVTILPVEEMPIAGESDWSDFVSNEEETFQDELEVLNLPDGLELPWEEDAGQWDKCCEVLKTFLKTSDNGVETKDLVASLKAFGFGRYADFFENRLREEAIEEAVATLKRYDIDEKDIEIRLKKDGADEPVLFLQEEETVTLDVEEFKEQLRNEVGRLREAFTSVTGQVI
jgi:HK97 family phage prohead protease